MNDAALSAAARRSWADLFLARDWCTLYAFPWFWVFWVLRLAICICILYSIPIILYTEYPLKFLPPNVELLVARFGILKGPITGNVVSQKTRNTFADQTFADQKGHHYREK